MMEDCCSGRVASTANSKKTCDAASAGGSGRCTEILGCSPSGSILAEYRYDRWEPYDIRVSRTVLREAPGEMPGAYSPGWAYALGRGSRAVRCSQGQASEARIPWRRPYAWPPLRRGAAT